MAEAVSFGRLIAQRTSISANRIPRLHQYGVLISVVIFSWYSDGDPSAFISILAFFVVLGFVALANFFVVDPKRFDSYKVCATRVASDRSNG